MIRSLTWGPYESAVSMKLTPSSTALLTTRMASLRPAVSPQIPLPVSRIVPSPSRATRKSSPISNSPLRRAVSCSRFPDASIACPPFLLFVKSCVQEQRRVFHEELRVLVLRAVIGVGVDDQLRIRDVLLDDEGVDRGHDHIVAAVHDERWLLDRLQIVVGPVSLNAPLLHRFDLGGRHLVVHFGIAPLRTKMRALQKRPSRGLARLGRTELDCEPDVLGGIVGGAEEAPGSLGQRLHTLTAARAGADEDQLANEIRRLQRDFLRDHAAD